MLFNWQLGRDLVVRKAEEKWGSGIVEQVSLDLQAAFPETRGFSPSNLWRMKQWYLFYSKESEILAQVGREIHDSLKTGSEGGVCFPDCFALVPWKHHVEIVTKSESVEEALFYVLKTISESWSRSTLINCINSDLYHNSGGAITNYAEKLPSPQSELAQAITKDTYDNIQVKKIQEQLPTIEELKSRIRLLEEELNKGK